MATIGHAAIALIAGFQWKLGRLALGVMLLFTFLPDVDVAISFLLTGSLFAMHRGFTHSLLFACIPLAIWVFIRRYELLWGFAGAISHVLIDVLDSHGGPLLWPLSNQMFGLDLWSSTSIRDISVQGILSPDRFISDKLLLLLLIVYLIYYFGARWYRGSLKRGR